MNKTSKELRKKDRLVRESTLKCLNNKEIPLWSNWKSLDNVSSMNSNISWLILSLMLMVLPRFWELKLRKRHRKLRFHHLSKYWEKWLMMMGMRLGLWLIRNTRWRSLIGRKLRRNWRCISNRRRSYRIMRNRWWYFERVGGFIIES